MAQPILQIDPRDRGRKPAQVPGGGADKPGQLAEAPVGRRDGFRLARQDQREAVAVVATRLDPHLAALQHPGTRTIGAILHRALQLR